MMTRPILPLALALVGVIPLACGGAPADEQPSAAQSRGKADTSSHTEIGAPICRGYTGLQYLHAGDALVLKASACSDQGDIHQGWATGAWTLRQASGKSRCQKVWTSWSGYDDHGRCLDVPPCTSVRTAITWTGCQRIRIQSSGTLVWSRIKQQRLLRSSGCIYRDVPYWYPNKLSCLLRSGGQERREYQFGSD